VGGLGGWWMGGWVDGGWEKGGDLSFAGCGQSAVFILADEGTKAIPLRRRRRPPSMCPLCLGHCTPRYAQTKRFRFHLAAN